MSVGRTDHAAELDRDAVMAQAPHRAEHFKNYH